MGKGRVRISRQGNINQHYQIYSLPSLDTESMMKKKYLENKQVIHKSTRQDDFPALIRLVNRLTLIPGTLKVNASQARSYVADNVIGILQRAVIMAAHTKRQDRPFTGLSLLEAAGGSPAHIF